MRDPQLIGFIFLLSVTVVAAYFYLKRAQRRTPVTGTDVTATAESRSESSWDAPASTPPSALPATSPSAPADQPQSDVERGS